MGFLSDKKVVGGSDSNSVNNGTNLSASQNQGYNSGLGINYGTTQGGNFGTSQGSSSQSSSGGGSSQSTQNVWGAQSPFLKDVYGSAQDAFNSGMANVEGLTPEVQGQMQQAFQQAQGGFGNQMGGGFASGLQGQIGPNSYVDAMKGQIADDANTLKQQNLGSLDARAAAAGMSGSSGYRDQVSRMQDSVDENAMNQMANIGYQAHDRGIQNQMNLANMMDQNQQFGTNNLQNMQQGAMNQFNPAMVGQQMAGNYAQTIGGPTTLTDSSSSNFSQSSGSSNNNSTNMGFNNGVNMGVNMNSGMNFGNSFGSGVSSGNTTSNTNNGLLPAVSPFFG